MIGHSGGKSHNGTLRPGTRPACRRSATRLFQPLPATPPPRRRSSAGYERLRDVVDHLLHAEQAEDEERGQVDERHEGEEEQHVRRHQRRRAEVDVRPGERVVEPPGAAMRRAAARACPRERAPTAPQSASATSIGQIISQSMRGCKRLAGAVQERAGDAHRRTALPEFRQALHRDRHRRPQLLREQRHAQLLQQPAELLELRARRRRCARARPSSRR